MATIRNIGWGWVGPTGVKLFRVLVVASLFAFSFLTFMDWRTASHVDHPSEAVEAISKVATKGMPEATQIEPQTNASAIRRPASPKHFPVSRRSESIRHAAQARIERREAELNRARMRYLKIRRQIALGKIPEKEALKVRARVEEALAALQEEKDRLFLLQSNDQQQ